MGNGNGKWADKAGVTKALSWLEYDGFEDCNLETAYLKTSEFYISEENVTEASQLYKDLKDPTNRDKHYYVFEPNKEDYPTLLISSGSKYLHEDLAHEQATLFISIESVVIDLIKWVAKDGFTDFEGAYDKIQGKNEEVIKHANNMGVALLAEDLEQYVTRTTLARNGERVAEEGHPFIIAPFSLANDEVAELVIDLQDSNPEITPNQSQIRQR